MKATVKIVLAMFAFLAVVALGIYTLILKAIDEVDFKPLVSTHIIDFKENQQHIYIRAMRWGLTYDHDELAISGQPIAPGPHKAEPEQSCVFYCTEMYYKKHGQDTLLIFVPDNSVSDKTPLPKTFGKIKFAIQKITTISQMRDYEQNYTKYGLTKISVYP